jgi:hypothetical protein
MAKQHPAKAAAEETPAERQEVLHPFRATGKIKAVFKTREELNDWEQEQKSSEMYRAKFNALEGLYSIGSVSDTFNNRLYSLFSDIIKDCSDALPDNKQRTYNSDLQNWERLSTDDMLSSIKKLLDEIDTPVILSPAGNNSAQNTITLTGEEKIFQSLIWNKNKDPHLFIDILKQLEAIRDVKIDLNNLNQILSLDNLLMFTEKTKNKPRNKNILCLLYAMEQCEFIEPLLDKQNFIERILKVFISENKEFDYEVINSQYSRNNREFQRDERVEYYKTLFNKRK